MAPPSPDNGREQLRHHHADHRAAHGEAHAGGDERSDAGMTILVKICASFAPSASATSTSPRLTLRTPPVGVDDDREEAGEEDDHDLGEQAEAEPQDEQRDERERSVWRRAR